MNLFRLKRSNFTNQKFNERALPLVGLVSLAALSSVCLLNCAEESKVAAPPQDGQLKSIQARASAAAAKVDFTNPTAVKQGNAKLARIHADLVAYAKASGLKLTTTTYKHPVGTIAVQRCPEIKDCILDRAHVDRYGNLICEYSCVVVVEKPKKKERLQP